MEPATTSPTPLVATEPTPAPVFASEPVVVAAELPPEPEGEPTPPPVTDLAARDFLSLGEVPARFIPRDPVTNAEIPEMWIDFLSADGQTGVQKRHELENARAIRRAMRLQSQKKQIAASGQLPSPVITMEEWDAEQVEHLAALATGWRVIWKGGELPFTTENVRWLLGRLQWLRLQAAAFVGDITAYLGN